MRREKEMRAAGKAMRACVYGDETIIALRSPKVWAAGSAIALASIAVAHVACMAAMALSTM